MRGIVDQSHSGQPGPLARRLITVHDQEDNHTSSRRGSISRTLQKPEDAFSWSMAGLGGLRSVCILTPNTDSSESHHSTNIWGSLEEFSLLWICLCNIKQQFARGLSLCGHAEGYSLALWVHHFGFPYTQNEDGSPAQKKVQETTEILPTRYLPGNLNQHRCWATRLPNTARHRPQR